MDGGRERDGRAGWSGWRGLGFETRYACVLTVSWDPLLVVGMVGFDLRLARYEEAERGMGGQCKRLWCSLIERKVVGRAVLCERTLVGGRLALSCGGAISLRWP